MGMSAAQDEFNELFRDKDRQSRHPEDRTASDSDLEEASVPGTFHEGQSDEDDNQPHRSRSRYFVPSLRSDANTGPKGVIADAQAFEQAKRTNQFSQGGTKESAPAPISYLQEAEARYTNGDKSSEDDLERDGFMQRWRQSRLRQLQASTSEKERSRSRNKRVYGTLVAVDADGYLDAIEKVPADTVVVVLIYDNQSAISGMVEKCVRELAKRHNTTRFVKLHYVDAEMEVAGVPAVLAYRGAEKFAGLVPVIDEIPEDADLSASSLENVLKRR
ncbi:hypothetical protein LTR04_001992, partial [Oleoguttula sp. CCFEE 6159]